MTWALMDELQSNQFQSDRKMNMWRIKYISQGPVHITSSGKYEGMDMYGCL